ncbi:hypothetical protein [Streptomyces sp. 5-6(2022)]|uniref:hypothetical protein n=1 Tax=Streptomyces sp. 5-6(2022) TaxID=2936510 RepID=UPI0023B9A916|nr:hypothetical protein [Streptomyces sp. 5-6(2022)]
MSLLRRRSRPAQLAADAAGASTAHPLVLSDERMASHISSVYFTVRITGSWQWTHGDTGQGDLAMPARAHLRRQAAGILCRHSVLDLAAAHDDINSCLSQRGRPMPGLEVSGMAELSVAAADRALAEEHARRQQAADLEHGEELHRLAQLQRVLADPDLRRVWWMAQFPDRFNDLDNLAQALKGLPAPQEAQDDDLRGDIRRFTDDLVTTLHTPQQREVFVQALVQTLTALGHQRLATATALRHRPHDPGSTPA